MARPKSKPSSLKHRVYVTLDTATIKFLEKLGEGNVSRGIRRAAKEIKETEQEKPYSPTTQVVSRVDQHTRVEGSREVRE